ARPSAGGGAGPAAPTPTPPPVVIAPPAPDTAPASPPPPATPAPQPPTPTPTAATCAAGGPPQISETGNQVSFMYGDVVSFQAGQPDVLSVVVAGTVRLIEIP